MKREREIKGFDGIFAERLRALMDETKTTQKSLAEQTDSSRQTISQYMDGTAMPNIEKLRNICKYFDVPSDYLLGFTNLKSTNMSEQYLKDITGLSNEAIKTLNTIYHGTFPNQLFATPSEFDIGVINYLLSDLDIMREFLRRLFNYFDEKQIDDEVINERFKQRKETDIARYSLKTLLIEQLIDDCYDNFFKTYKSGKKARCKPGRKRKESISDTNTKE